MRRVLVVGVFLWVNLSVGNLQRVKAQAPGTVDPVFGGASLGLARNVAMIATQGDGKLLVAGGTDGLVRLNADGSTDTTFRAVVNYSRLLGLYENLAVAVQRDGKIILAGNFTEANSVPCPGVVRLNSDGSTDTSFSAKSDQSVGSNIVTIALQTDGKILLGGFATTTAGVTNAGIIRINHDGSVDSSFNAAINPSDLSLLTTNPSEIYTILAESNGKILIAGVFAEVNGVFRPSFARLNSDGTVDMQFDPPQNGQLSAFAEQADGKLLVSGSFTLEGEFGEFQTYLERLNVDGSVDLSYSPFDEGFLPYLVTVDSNGKAILAGLLNDKESVLIRLNTDGSNDTSFGTFTNQYSVTANKRVLTVLAQPNGDILLAGQFTSVQGFSCNSVAQLMANGDVDTTFTPDISSAPNGTVEAVALQSDGKIVIGGEFTQVQGVAYSYVARLNSSGTPDPAFHPALAGTNIGTYVGSLAFQNDGKLLIGGAFTTVDGRSCVNIARLNADSTFDTTFTPSVTGIAVNEVAIQADGKILLLTLAEGSDGLVDDYQLIRLNANGDLDSSFKTSFRGTISNFVIQPDGKILVGGTPLLGEGSPILIRLNLDSTVDDSFHVSFDTSSDAVVSCLAIEPDGRIVVAGILREAAGAADKFLTRINSDGSLDTTFAANLDDIVYAILSARDGTIVLGGAFKTVDGIPTEGFARLYANGHLDPFSTASVNGLVYALGEQADGKVILGGTYTSVDAVLRNNMARTAGRNDPTFFDNEAEVGGGFYYLQFANGTPFGYYALAGGGFRFPYFFHADLGMEYFFDANDGNGGAYMYDFASNTFFYTSPSFPFPYMYDFKLNSVLYYYPDTTNPGHYTSSPRYFYNFGAGQIITK